MWKGIKVVFKNVVLLTFSLGVLLALGEGAARIFLLPSDLPMLQPQESNGEVLRYAPDQSGTYRIRNEIAASFKINTDGWNSRWTDYKKEKESGQTRICIVGDSYVEALQVDFRKSLAERLEDYLAPGNIQVYRFGLSGAALSHYLYMLREEVLQYSPDLVIINMVHNDFIESFKAVAPGVYDASLAKVKFEDNGSISGLTIPQAYKRSWSSKIKSLALFRYFWVRQQIRVLSLRDRWVAFVNGVSVDDEFASNIRVENGQGSRIDQIIDYLFAELEKFQADNGIPVLLVMDAHRGFIQQSPADPNARDSLAPLHAKVAMSAVLHNLELIDLTEHMRMDYVNNQIPFSFRNDGHWNGYSHSLVANVVGERIQRQILSSLEGISKQR